jgi:MFS family permease
MSPSNEDARGYEGWRVAAASSVGVFVASLAPYVFSVFLKPIAEEFSWSRQAVSSAYGVMAAAAALSAAPLGWLLDRFGARRVALPCFVLSACGMAALSLLAPPLGHLWAVFALMGVAVSGSSVLAYSRAVSSWFERRRGLALGVVVAGGALGGIVHPPVAQALIGLVGWRGASLALGVAVLAIGLPAVARFVRENPRAGPAGGGAMAGASVREACRSPAFWILVVAVFGVTLAGHGAMVHVPAMLSDRGVPEGLAALALSALGGASLAGRLLTGWLLDRFDARRVACVLAAVAALGTFLLANAPSFATATLAAALVGFGTGGELDVTPYLLARYFGLRSVSTLYGVTWMALGAAGAVGPLLLGRAFDASGSYAGVLERFAAGMVVVGALLLALPGRSQFQHAPER